LESTAAPDPQTLDAVRDHLRERIIQITAGYAESNYSRASAAGELEQLVNSYIRLGGDLDLEQVSPLPPPMLPAEAEALIKNACAFVSVLPGLSDAFDHAEDLRRKLEETLLGEGNSPSEAAKQR
jgi:hypothetical protein